MIFSKLIFSLKNICKLWTTNDLFYNLLFQYAYLNFLDYLVPSKVEVFSFFFPFYFHFECYGGNHVHHIEFVN